MGRTLVLSPTTKQDTGWVDALSLHFPQALQAKFMQQTHKMKHEHLWFFEPTLCECPI